MSVIKQPSVAGQFYPAEQQILSKMLDRLLDGADQYDNLPTPKAIIVPHAGYIYSGPIAANVYNMLRENATQIRKVILLGPSHHVPLRGIAASEANYFSTPLGQIPVDKDLNAIALAQPGVGVLEKAFSPEHCLEVQLPFLQTVLAGGFTIVPLIVGHIDPKVIANVIKHLWGDSETLIVISSDLSHYHDYKTAKSLDSGTSEAILAMHGDLITPDRACGSFPIKGLLELSSEMNLTATMLDLRNSGDTAGPKDRVVGYGAYHFI